MTEEEDLRPNCIEKASGQQPHLLVDTKYGRTSYSQVCRGVGSSLLRVWNGVEGRRREGESGQGSCHSNLKQSHRRVEQREEEEEEESQRSEGGELVAAASDGNGSTGGSVQSD